MLRMLREDPSIAKSSTESELPKRDIPYILMALPSRTKLRMLMLLPNMTKSRTASELPILAIPYTLTALPSRMRVLKLRQLPIDTKSKTLKLDPMRSLRMVLKSTRDVEDPSLSVSCLDVPVELT